MSVRKVGLSCVGSATLILGTMGVPIAGAQESLPGSDALRGVALAEVRQEDESGAAGREGEDEGDGPERLMREIETLRAQLREREEELRNSMLQRQVDRAQRAEEAARRALDEAALAERLQGVIRAGQSRYWIGVQTAKLTDEQRRELNLEASVTGVVVESVVDNSPAKSAGLQKGDVIASVDGDAIQEVGQLIAAVTKAENRAMKLGVVRGMDRLTLEVTPAERPSPFELAQGIPGFEMEMDAQGLLPRGLRLPGMNLEGVPAGMSIQVTREGDGPAKIKVDYQGKTYEVTSESIEELPEEIRDQVRGMVDGNGIQILRGFADGDLDLRMPGAMELRLPPVMIPREGFRLPDDDLRDEVEKLRGEMNELRKVIEELRKSIM